MKWEIAQFFEIRWWQHYLGQQEVEDYLSRKKNYWEGILSACPFALSPSYRILDAGCGPAGIFTILQDYQVDAIDPLIDQYEKVLPHFSRRQYPNTQFFPTTFEHFSPTATYDLVFCLNAVNHFKNITLAMEKLGTLTAPGQWLALSIDTHKWRLAKHLFRMIPADLLHPHQYDLKEYEQMLTSAGFKIFQTEKLKNGYIFDYHIIFAKRI
jgi:SAM-dependent methyltransferase